MRKLYEYLICNCFGGSRKKHYPSHKDPAGFLAAAVSTKKSVRRISSRVDSDESLADDSTASSKSDRLEVAPPGSTLTRLPKFSLKKLKKKGHKKKSTSSDQLVDEDSDFKETSMSSGGRKTGFKVKKILSTSYSSHDGTADHEPSRKFKNIVLDTMRLHKIQKQTPPEPESANNSSPECSSSTLDRSGFDFSQSFPRGFTDPIEYPLSTSFTNTLDSNLDDKISLSSSTMSIHTEDDRGEGDGASLADIGSVEYPTRECFGTVTFSVQSISPKALGVHIYSIQGIPCTKGREEGLCLEVTTVQGGKSVWLPIKNARASKIYIDNQVTVKLSPGKRRDHSSLTLRITVWTAGRTWKHSAIGHVVYPCSRIANKEVCQLGVFQHLQMYRELGVIEVSIACVSCRTSGKGSKSSKVSLRVDIVRAKLNMEDEHKKHSIKHLGKENRDIWCRLSVWCRGQRTHKDQTPRTRIPITNDPVFRSSSVFNMDRSSLSSASLVIKLIVDKALGEAVYGRLILGPHLYLGDPRENVAPGTLSHWGRALTHPGPVKAWHTLYL